MSIQPSEAEETPVVISTASTSALVIFADAPTPTVAAEGAIAPIFIPEPGSVTLVDPEDDENSLVVVTPPSVPQGLILGQPGPKGDPGPEGPRGPEGPPAPLDQLAHVHIQDTPNAEWIIRHQLPYFPNLTVVDSAGTVVEGDVEYVDEQTIRLSFCGGFSGTAYLS